MNDMRDSEPTCTKYSVSKPDMLRWSKYLCLLEASSTWTEEQHQAVNGQVHWCRYTYAMEPILYTVTVWSIHLTVFEDLYIRNL